MENEVKSEIISISGHVGLAGDTGYVRHAEVHLSVKSRKAAHEIVTETDDAGRFSVDRGLEAGQTYIVKATAFGVDSDTRSVEASTAPRDVELGIPLELHLGEAGQRDDAKSVALRGVAGKRMLLMLESPHYKRFESVEWSHPHGASIVKVGLMEAELMTTRPAPVRLEIAIRDNEINLKKTYAEAIKFAEIGMSEPDIQTIGGRIGVTMLRTASDPTLDQALWVAIRNRANAVSFASYRDFLNRVLRWDETERFPEALERRMKDLGANLHGVGAYQVLKLATEIFLLMQCGVKMRRGEFDRFRLDPLEEKSRLNADVSHFQMQARLQEYLGNPPQLPYITRVVESAFPEYNDIWRDCDRVLTARINEPCLLELIWSYWHEEGMLMQSINALANRFQNVRRPGGRDPLLAVEIDPLRPLNNLLWGYVQDEAQRISVKRRAYEYLHQYGLVLFGRATSNLRPAEVRSRFVSSLNNLIAKASEFFKEDYQTTVIADGFPLLNALKDVHMVLAEGAHNQFGDLTWTARVEMLLAQYMLARPEVREFLQSRIMVPYKEPWMGQVDTMKTLQGWTDISVSHFSDLGVFGEQILLSVRYGDWINVNNEDSAKNWARYWRPEIQGYMHSYRAATGVDLTSPETSDTSMPGVLLQKRLTAQRIRTRPEIG